MNSTTTLIIISTPPTLDLEPLELILAMAAFEQAPKVLLLGQGIHYFNKFQQAKKPNGKSPAKVASALPMYDCEEVFVREQDLEIQGLDRKDLQDFCSLVDNEQIKHIINQSKHCVNF